MKKIVCIVPASASHREVPRLNSKVLVDRPLISHVIRTAKKSSFINDLYVSTEDEELISIAEFEGVKVVGRSNEFSSESCDFDNLLADALRRIEEKENCSYEYVMILQANNPLISKESIDSSVELVLNGEFDTVLSVVEDTGLKWTEKDSLGRAMYEERANTPELEKIFKETGGITICKRDNIANNKKKIGSKVKLFKLKKDEGLEIKSFFEWWIAEKLLLKKKVLIRVEGYREIGLGHIQRTLILANRLSDHDCLFVSYRAHQLGITKIKKDGFDVLEVESEDEVFSAIDEYKPDIIINDILDTDAEYVRKLKQRGLFVVNFEDLGPGARVADIVINALYGAESNLNSLYYGEDYYCLREEFYKWKKKKINPEVGKILLTFGGTDPCNYTERIFTIIRCIKEFKGEIVIIAGLGYKYYDKLKKSIAKLDCPVTLKRDIRDISKYMFEADIAITSTGRTIYELTSLGVPTITIAQNERELQHSFARKENGIINLGMGKNKSDVEIQKVIKDVIFDFSLRNELNTSMLKKNLKKGINNVLFLIWSQFELFKGIKNE